MEFFEILQAKKLVKYFRLDLQARVEISKSIHKCSLYTNRLKKKDLLNQKSLSGKNF